MINYLSASYNTEDKFYFLVDNSLKYLDIKTSKIENYYDFNEESETFNHIIGFTTNGPYIVGINHSNLVTFFDICDKDFQTFYDIEVENYPKIEECNYKPFAEFHSKYVDTDNYYLFLNKIDIGVLSLFNYDIMSNFKETDSDYFTKNNINYIKHKCLNSFFYFKNNNMTNSLIDDDNDDDDGSSLVSEEYFIFFIFSEEILQFSLNLENETVTLKKSLKNNFKSASLEKHENNKMNYLLGENLYFLNKDFVLIKYNITNNIFSEFFEFI